MGSACRIGELTCLPLPGAETETLGHYEPSAFNG
jgi:hypothetical protein